MRVQHGKCSGGEQCQGDQEVCVNAEPGTEICDGRRSDEDCDGRSDEGFDLQTDERNCGACGNSCGSAQTCCGGGCVDTQSSNGHCGSCGSACADGLTCCSGSCIDVRAGDNQNCGSCGKACLLGCSKGSCTLIL